MPKIKQDPYGNFVGDNGIFIRRKDSQLVSDKIRKHQLHSISSERVSRPQVALPLVLNQTDRRKFTSKELADPAMMLENLSKRVAVLARLDQSKKQKMLIEETARKNMKSQQRKARKESEQRAQELDKM